MKSGLRAARWPRYEVLLMHKALLAECDKAQRIDLASFLTSARKSLKSAEEVYAEGMNLLAEFIAANEKALAA